MTNLSARNMRKRATELNELEEGKDAIYLPTGLDTPHQHTNGHKPSKQVCLSTAL